MTGVLRTLCGLAVVLVSASLPSRSADTPPKIAILAYHRFSAGTVTGRDDGADIDIPVAARLPDAARIRDRVAVEPRDGPARRRHGAQARGRDHGRRWPCLGVQRDAASRSGIRHSGHAVRVPVRDLERVLRPDLAATRSTQQTGLFDVQSHTWWHPNFKTEKRRLSPTAYRAFATKQLVESRTILRERLGVSAELSRGRSASLTTN